MIKTGHNLLESPVDSTILKMAGGMLFGYFAMSAFNVVDTYFVGKLGAIQLAAMGYTFPVVMVVGSIAMGLGVGLSSNVSRAIGSGNHSRVKRLTSDGLVLAVFIVLVFVVAGLITIKPLFSMLGAEGKTLDYVCKYMRIWYVGMPFVVIPMAGNNVIRATGDTLIPSLIMVVSVIVNSIMDPLLIFGIGVFPEMGISGAALATVLSRFTTFIFSLSVLAFSKKLITIKLPSLEELLINWKNIAFIGLPAALVQAITPITLGIITSILSRFGDNVVAGFGTAGKIEMLILIIPNSLGAVMAPFAGQNWGAQKLDRIQRGLRFSSLISLFWSGIVFIVFICFGKQIMGIFSTNKLIVSTAVNYIIIMSIGYGFFGVMIITSQVFNALNKPFNSAAISMIKAFAINISLAFLGARLFNEIGVFASSLVSNISGGIMGFFFLAGFLKNQDKRSKTE